MSKLSPEILSRLNKRFGTNEVEKNPRGFHYIPIHIMIKNANEDFEWDHVVTEQNITTIGDVIYVSVVSKITIYDGDDIQTRFGVGGANGTPNANFNYDAIVKTAMSNSIKKAFNNHGYGLYLWEEEERQEIEAAKVEIIKQTATVLEENKEKFRAIAKQFSINNKELDQLILDVHQKVFETPQKVTNAFNNSITISAIDYDSENEQEAINAIKKIKTDYIKSEFQYQYVDLFVTNVSELYNINDLYVPTNEDKVEEIVEDKVEEITIPETEVTIEPEIPIEEKVETEIEETDDTVIRTESADPNSILNNL